MEIILSILILLILFFWNRNRYINLLFTAFVLVSITINILAKTFFNSTSNETLNYILITVFIFGFIPFVLLGLAVLTFFNSKILLEKEGRRPHNLLIALIGVASLAVLFMYMYYYIFVQQSTQTEVIIIYVIGLFVYGMVIFSATSIYATLYNLMPIFFKPRYIIVLGSGLIGDRVPPLLASRIREGVKQYKKYGRKPLLIMSGGQGNDELLSEGAAMRNLAIEELGLAEHEVIAEVRSTTTLENLQFSKELLKAHGVNGKGIIVSNNFHVLRAGFYAKEANLNAVGIGSKTAFYYVPNAFVREFIAILQMHKWWHIIVFLGYSLFSYIYLIAYR